MRFTAYDSELLKLFFTLSVIKCKKAGDEVLKQRQVTHITMNQKKHKYEFKNS